MGEKNQVRDAPLSSKCFLFGRFPSSPEVKSLCFYCRSSPRWGNYDPTCSAVKNKQTNKQVNFNLKKLQKSCNHSTYSELQSLILLDSLTACFSLLCTNEDDGYNDTELLTSENPWRVSWRHCTLLGLRKYFSCQPLPKPTCG